MSHKLLNTKKKKERKKRISRYTDPAGSNYQRERGRGRGIQKAIRGTHAYRSTHISILSLSPHFCLFLLSSIVYPVFHSANSIDFCSLLDLSHPSLHLAAPHRMRSSLAAGLSIVEISFFFIQLALRSTIVR